jgi:WD40 repeat protein
LITASADQTLRIWELQTGKSLFEFQLGAPCRSVDLAVGDHLLAFTTDSFTQSPPSIHIVNHEADISEQTDKKILTIVAPKGRTTRVYWADENRSLISSHDGGFLRRWDVEVRVAVGLLALILARQVSHTPPRLACMQTGKMLMETQVHEDSIQDLQIAPDGIQGITASLDKTAKLIDMQTFTVLKTYKTGRLVNSAALSPICDHVSALPPPAPRTTPRQCPVCLLACTALAGLRPRSKHTSRGQGGQALVWVLAPDRHHMPACCCTGRERRSSCPEVSVKGGVRALDVMRGQATWERVPAAASNMRLLLHWQHLHHWQLQPVSRAWHQAARRRVPSSRE